MEATKSKEQGNARFKAQNCVASQLKMGGFGGELARLEASKMLFVHIWMLFIFWATRRDTCPWQNSPWDWTVTFFCGGGGVG